MARYDANGISLVLISTDMTCNRVDGERNATTGKSNAGIATQTLQTRGMASHWQKKGAEGAAMFREGKDRKDL